MVEIVEISRKIMSIVLTQLWSPPGEIFAHSNVTECDRRHAPSGHAITDRSAYHGGRIQASNGEKALSNDVGRKRHIQNFIQPSRTSSKMTYCLYITKG